MYYEPVLLSLVSHRQWRVRGANSRIGYEALSVLCVFSLFLLIHVNCVRTAPTDPLLPLVPLLRGRRRMNTTVCGDNSGNPVYLAILLEAYLFAFLSTNRGDDEQAIEEWLFRETGFARGVRTYAFSRLFARSGPAAI